MTITRGPSGIYDDYLVGSNKHMLTLLDELVFSNLQIVRGMTVYTNNAVYPKKIN